MSVVAWTLTWTWRVVLSFGSGSFRLSWVRGRSFRSSGAQGLVTGVAATSQYCWAGPRAEGCESTDFNHHRGTQTVTEGTDAIVHLATLPPDGPTGTFQDRHGPSPGRSSERSRTLLVLRRASNPRPC